MFHVKAAQPNGVLSRYQPNASHLHKSGKPTEKPPLPSTKPPSRIPSHIPTKMQNLEPSVVNRFLQAVNGGTSEKPPVKTSTIIPKVSKNEIPSNFQNTVSNNRWKDNNSKDIAQGNSVKSPDSDEKRYAASSTTPSWAAKRPTEFAKPSWNAKALEKPKAVWSAKSHPVANGNTPTSPERLVLRHEEVNRTPEWMTARSSFGNTDWRVKYEEADRKRKELLVESQRVEREKSALERRLTKLENEHQLLRIEHEEKSQQLSKLSQVSEKVYQNYDELNKKYEVETSALHRALGAASKWYMENKKLRRESIARGANASSPLDDVDGEDQDQLEELRKTVQDLSQQIGHLQSELNRAKLQEFESQENLMNLSQQLCEERSITQRQEKELKELRLMREKFESVTVMVQGEVESLRQQRDQAIGEVGRLQTEAHQAKTERNVLAHQSSLLMGDITPEDRLVKVLLEVEDLKRQMENQKHKHDLEIMAVQERLEEGQSDTQLELLEEKLKLAESELQLALERAEQAEQCQIELKRKVETLEEKKVSNAPCIPPPPPPPPMPPCLNESTKIIRKQVHRPTEGDSLEDMARLLGIQRTPKAPAAQGGAIDNIISEIKGGKFTLKATEKQQIKKEEPPAAVQEMLSIIGTLKRRPRRQAPNVV